MTWADGDDEPQESGGFRTGGVSVVVPVYRSTTTLATLVLEVHKALDGTPHEIVLVDDGSPADTWNTVTAIAAGDPTVVGLRLGRNSGQHNALLAGVREAVFDVTVTIDDDLQNPPSQIPLLLDALDSSVDVVYGTPHDVAQRGWRRAAGWLSRSLMASALGADSVRAMSSFRAFRTRLRDGFDGDLGPSVSLDAVLSWSTSRFGSVEVRHDERHEGTSHYSLRKLVRFAIDTATGYSTRPLQVATTLGLLTALFGVGVLVWVIGRTIIDGGSVPGFPFLASIVSIFAGAQLVTLGIIGEYLARMHFRIMRKPSYLVAERVTGESR